MVRLAGPPVWSAGLSLRALPQQVLFHAEAPASPAHRRRNPPPPATTRRRTTGRNHRPLAAAIARVWPGAPDRLAAPEAERPDCAAGSADWRRGGTRRARLRAVAGTATERCRPRRRGHSART